MLTSRPLCLAALLSALGFALISCGGGSDGPNCDIPLDTNQFPSSTLSYATHIVPILETNYCAADKNCSCNNAVCHGASTPESSFSTKTLTDIFKGGELSRSNGACTIVRGDPDSSYMVQKLEGRSGERMPSPVDPRDTAPAMPQNDLDTIRQWISEGAYP
ncbi:MAG: hypothetical protein KC503_14900 [Myxococcales bacterium]|nr:hypothetical protein [Myxococcales bacterium]